MNRMMEDFLKKTDSTLVSYKGKLKDDTLEMLYKVIEARLDQPDIDKALKKKIYYIAVECLQNAYRHGPDPAAQGEEQKTEFAIARKGNNYKVVTANYILNNETAALKSSLDTLSKFQSGEMTDHYRKKLASTALSGKGGAGLGLIDIKRKSKAIDYSFMSGSRYSRFLLAVTV